MQKEQGVWPVVRELARRLLRLQFQSKQAFADRLLQRDIASEADTFAQLLAQFEKALQGKRLVIFESSGHGFNHPKFKSAFQSALKKYNPALDAVAVEGGAFVGAQQNIHGTVLHRGVVQHHTDGQDVVVGMGVKRPVLVPFHRGSEARCFQVEFGALQAGRRADQRL